MELDSCWTLLNSCSFLRFQARHRVMTWHLSWRSGNHWPLLGAVTVAIREQCENVTKQPLMSSRIERTQYIYTHQISQLYYILICIYINIHIYSYTYICYIYIIYIYWESTGENRDPYPSMIRDDISALEHCSKWRTGKGYGADLGVPPWLRKLPYVYNIYCIHRTIYIYICIQYMRHIPWNHPKR